MNFIEIARAFASIEQVSGRLEITRLLAELLGAATFKEAGIICYFSLGTLNSPYIGTQFNLARKSLEVVVAQLLDVSEKEVSHQLKTLGDLGSVVAQGTWKGKTVSVEKVYDKLKEIEAFSGAGSLEKKQSELVVFLKTVDPLCAKYIVRIIEGTLRLGFSDMTILDALSWMQAGDKSLRKDIEDAYNRCADIGLIAQVLKQDGIEAIKKMHVKVGIPIRPAAAERLPTAADIVEKLGPCIAQPKLDGFRIQIHLDKTGKEPVVRFFSRHLTDMSAMFPDLTQAVAKLDVKSMICEGEAIVFDPATGTFLPFQATVKRKRKHGIEQAVSEYPLKVYLFDLLYFDGKEFLDNTHTQRRAQLVEITDTYQGDVVKLIEEKKITTAKELEEYFVENIAAGLEGLVVKKSQSIYQPGKRNFNWIKLKRQEEGHLEDTLDCVILGYYFGRGKRADFGIGAFLVGVYNKDRDLFQTIAKVGTGLKDDEWKELKKKCDALKSSSKPNNVVCAKELFPDVWVYPEIVTLIRADEITLSPVHTTGKTEKALGYALRFPRFMGYRTDKSANEATMVSEIRRLYEDQFKKDKK